MSEKISTGKRTIPDEEEKFGVSLHCHLAFSPETEVRVIIHAPNNENDELGELIADNLTGESMARKIGAGLVVATISPPNIYSQLVGVAALDEVSQIDCDRPINHSPVVEFSVE